MTMCRSSFSSAKILIDTCQFQFIQGNIYLSLDGVRYDVFLKEAYNEFELWDDTKDSGKKYDSGDSLSEQMAETISSVSILEDGKTPTKVLSINEGNINVGGGVGMQVETCYSLEIDANHV